MTTNRILLSIIFSGLFWAVKDEEKKELIRSAVYDEILLREAIELNLHLVDKEVREQLISQMAFSLEPIADDPSEADLKAYFEEHREDFNLPPRYTFDHIFLQPGTELDPKTVSNTEDWKTLGDNHWAGNTIEDKPAYEIMLFLGESVAESLIS